MAKAAFTAFTDSRSNRDDHEEWEATLSSNYQKVITGSSTAAFIAHIQEHGSKPFILALIDDDESAQNLLGLTFEQAWATLLAMEFIYSIDSGSLEGCTIYVKSPSFVHSLLSPVLPDKIWKRTVKIIGIFEDK